MNLVRSVYQKGFFHLLSINFFAQFLTFGSSLLVAKFLTPTEFGNIRILQSYTTLFAVIAGFGFNSAVLKFCSENRPIVERQSILYTAFLRASGTTIIAWGFLAVLSLLGIITSSKNLSIWLLIYALIIPFSTATDLLTNFLQAIKKIKEMARAQGLLRIQSFVLIVLSTWLWGFKGFIYATIAAYILGLLPLLRQTGLQFLRIRQKIIPDAFYYTAIFSVLANGVSILGQFGDIFILDHFSTNRAEIGYYSLATIFILAASQVTGTIQAISTPYFSERASDREWLRRKLITTQTQAAVLGVVVSVGLYVAAWILIKVVYGPAYRSTLYYLPILQLRYVLWTSCAVIGPTLFATGHVRYNFINALIATPIGLVASYFLLKKFGTIGVAWAQVISISIMFLLSIVVIRYVLDKNKQPL